MEEITIDVVENIEEVTISVQEWSNGIALENVSVANVTNDTTPEPTDKLFLWREVKGWFYVYWQKLVSIFFAGGGFKANLYFTARDSDVAGYKLLSYQNDETPTTLTVTLGSEYTMLRSYIFNLPFGDTTIPEGLWKSILYGMVSSAAGDTTLRLDGFMRTGAGVETQIFSVESSSINNTTLDSIPNEQWLPQLTVDPDSFFGVKLYGKTTKGGGVTLTTVVGGANASYLITPSAFEHNLTRRRDAADCHPAKAITFDVDPVPDFTGVENGDTLEAITHKVAGLQDLDKMLQNLIQKDQWFDLYLNAANTSVTGSGTVVLQPKGSFVRTLGTAGSTSMIYLSRNSGYSNNKEYYTIDWSKNIIIVLYLMRQDVGTTESNSWAFLGSLEGDAAADPTRKGIGLKITNKAVAGICHNGTTMNTLVLGNAIQATVFGVTLHSKGDGNVDYYFNNVFIGTCTGGPTGISENNASSFRFLIKSIVGDSILGIFTIKMYIEQ